jgi:septum formation protein
MKVVLASESQSRKRALDILGLTYQVHPSTIDEKSIRIPARRAHEKARRGQGSQSCHRLRDAVVAKDNRIFEKPGSNEEAVEFLRELSGSAFQFVTSLTVLRSDTGRMLSAVETSHLKFRQLEDHELHDCVRTAMPVSRLAVFLREQGVEVYDSIRQ